MGQVQIYSRLDQEAFENLEQYRISIGLPAVADLQRPARISEIGAWADNAVCDTSGKTWDVFATGTFRPIIRRWRNPRGFAAVETALKERDPSTRFIEFGDYTERLASHSPSEAHVQRVFYEWIARVKQGLRTRVDFFVGFEAGRISGANHFHALLAAQNLREQLTREAELLRQSREAGKSVHDFVKNDNLMLWGYLYRVAGRSLVLPFDPGRGAGWYIAAAYVGKKQL